MFTSSGGKTSTMLCICFCRLNIVVIRKSGTYDNLFNSSFNLVYNLYFTNNRRIFVTMKHAVKCKNRFCTVYLIPYLLTCDLH